MEDETILKPKNKPSLITTKIIRLVCEVVCRQAVLAAKKIFTPNWCGNGLNVVCIIIHLESNRSIITRLVWPRLTRSSRSRVLKPIIKIGYWVQRDFLQQRDWLENLLSNILLPLIFKSSQHKVIMRVRRRGQEATARPPPLLWTWFSTDDEDQDTDGAQYCCLEGNYDL